MEKKYDRTTKLYYSNEFVDGFDYSIFKLFVLSILWRLSKSNIALAKRVNLGPHENRILTLLKNNDPGPDNNYPILISKI